MRETHFPSSGPYQGQWRVRFQDRRRVLGESSITWKGQTFVVQTRGDFYVEKWKPDVGDWEGVNFQYVPEAEQARYRMEFHCAGLCRERRLPLHQFLYFILSSKYTKDCDGWVKFKNETENVKFWADMMVVDHKVAWWYIERNGLQRITQTENARKPKCKLKPGTWLPRP